MFEILDKVCTPIRGTKYSAYVDLFAREDVVIGAGETKIVKLGIKLCIQDIQEHLINECVCNNEEEWNHFLKSHYLQVALRSSLGVKGLIIANGIGIIDLDYPDEIGLIVHNPIDKEQIVDIREALSQSDIYKPYKRFEISKGDKVAQCTLKEHKGWLMGYESDVIREGGFGSTGQK